LFSMVTESVWVWAPKVTRLRSKNIGRIFTDNVLYKYSEEN
jgi:hypothetical protein